jgi:hypothetical protein
MPPIAPRIDFCQLYAKFDAPVTDFDCGEKCAPHNPSGKPFCCDICMAAPVAYHREWAYLQVSTDVWQPWRGDECPQEGSDPEALLVQIPDTMLPLACQGPSRCQRDFRALSCRQFPFFPYISGRDRFLGLAYEWEFEADCWVISNLWSVTDRYRAQFIQAYERLFAEWEAEFDSYAVFSEEMRAHFRERKRRIPLLHRRGGFYLLSPGSERLERVPPERLPRFGRYKTSS